MKSKKHQHKCPTVRVVTSFIINKLKINIFSYSPLIDLFHIAHIAIRHTLHLKKEPSVYTTFNINTNIKEANDSSNLIFLPVENCPVFTKKAHLSRKFDLASIYF